MGKASSQNKFVRFITLPFRALGKARDFYVRSLTDCSSTVSYGNKMRQPGDLPKSFSVSSTRSNGSEDFRELVRAASISTLANRLEMDIFLQQQMKQQSAAAAAAGSKGVPRSASVGMGKIDEDKPYDFVGDNNVDVKNGLLYPRSKSYAIPKRSVLMA